MKIPLICILFFIAGKTVISQVSVDFTANNRVGCGVLQVLFQNNSTGPAASYKWNLGGIMSTAKNPSRIFIAPGKYNICLTVTDQNGKEETLCKNEFIEVKPSFKAAFTVSEPLICAGSSAQFNDLTKSPNGEITSLIWDLGGSTGTVQLSNSVPVTSIYKDPGLYAVTLYAKDEAGCESTVTQKDILTVLQKPEIKLTVPEIYCSLPASVKVTNLSQQSPELTFSWKIANGNTFNGYDPPAITITQEGRFALQVIATNTANNCSDTLNNPQGIIVENVSKFVLNKKVACRNDQIQFNSTSTLPEITHIWDFGDGAISNEANPAHQYTFPGCYTVTHTTSYKGCSSIQTADTCIRINDLPQPSFVLDKTKGCQFPLLVQATNNSPTGIIWTWKSNGVILSNDKNPLLRFETPGVYPIQLEVTNTEGCIATVEGSAVESYKIQPIISSGEIKGCGPLFYTLEHNSTSLDPITNVRWTVFTSVPKTVIGEVAAVVIPETGQFDVKLVVENSLGCADSIVVSDYIKVGSPPVTAMEFEEEICFGLPLQLTDKSDAIANEFQWEFGDGLDPDYTQNPTRIYNNTGDYVITHQAFFNGCPGNRVSANVRILGAKAEFEIQHNCNVPGEKLFINRSTGVDSVYWDFGLSGSMSDTSHRFNSQFNYPVPGNYPVILKVLNKASNCEDTASMYAFVSDLEASFALNTYESCSPAEINVINSSKDASVYQYTFGGAENYDADSSAPVILYTSGGNYSGSLIVTDRIGCRDTFKLPDTISIHQIQATITSSHQRYCQDSLVSLQANTQVLNDRIVNYNWVYGNQFMNNTPQIEVRIDSIQTNQIGLVVFSESGCRAETGFSIPSGNLKLGFTSDTLICNADSIRFYAEIGGRWNSLLWNFGDGQTSDQINPFHRYLSDGNYSISLTVQDGISGCNQTILKNNHIQIHDPIAVFEVLNAQEFCPPFIAKVTNESQYASRFEWSFGAGSPVSTEYEPSRLLTESGTYNVRLIAKSSDRCQDTVDINSAFVVHGPEVLFIKETFPKVCSPLPVNYLVSADGVDLLGIEYGDGFQEVVAKPGSETAFKHTYENGGLYYSIIFATDTFGCTSFKLLDTIDLHETTVKLGLTNTMICGPTGFVQLKNESTSSDPYTLTRLTLRINDVDTQFDYLPDSVLLEEFGRYSVKLVMGSDFCVDSIEYVDTLRLSPHPAANFEVLSSLLCAGDSVTFVDRSTAINEFINRVEWKIGSQKYTGSSLTLKLPPEGLIVRLLTGTENGCLDSLEQEISVNPSIQVDLSSDTMICSGSLLQLHANILNPVAGSSYFWRSGDHLLCDGCLDLVLRPDNTTTYTFEAQHPNGCLSIYETEVTTFRNNIGQLRLTEDTIICLSSIVPLLADAGEELYSYQWEQSRQGLSCYQNCRNPLASPDTTTTFIVYVTNTQGCERLDSITVYVNIPGGFDLGPDRTLCPGDTFGISVPGFENYRWTGSSGISCTNCADPVLRPLQPSLYILQATEDGCAVKDSIRLSVFSGELIPGRKDTTLCLGSSAQLKTVDQVNLNWLPSPWLNDFTLRNPTATPGENAVFYVQATEDLCTIVDSFSITVVNETQINARDRVVCPGEEFSITVEGDATSFKWSGPNIISGQNTNSIRSATRKDTTYTVIAQNHTCAGDTAVIRVTLTSFVELPEVVKINIIKSLPFQLNKSFKTDSSYFYSWAPDEDLSCLDCPNPILFTDSAKNLFFRIFDPTTGCELNQIVEVSVVESCQPEDYFSIPNIFTPNQDGLNDQLFVIPKAADLIKSFRIFDRTGDLVFETFDIQVGWDGRLKNLEVANGVYVYLIEADCPQLNQRIILSGDVTLIR